MPDFPYEPLLTSPGFHAAMHRVVDADDAIVMYLMVHGVNNVVVAEHRAAMLDMSCEMVAALREVRQRMAAAAVFDEVSLTRQVASGAGPGVSACGNA